MSRWGPKVVRPMPANTSDGLSLDQRNMEMIKKHNPDFSLIEDVEWQGDTNETIGELAPRPKVDVVTDPCGCSRPSDGVSKTCCDLTCVLFACQEECSYNCEAGELCGNRRIQKREWKQLEIIDAGPKGLGLRVLENVKKGELVAEYIGKAIPKSYLNRLFLKYQNERRLYIMALDSSVYLDARHKGGIARYINHSCEPNCVVERWKVDGILRAAVVAKTEIDAGTELSFDYQWERKRGRAPTKCHCGAATCRGTLEKPRSEEEKKLEETLSGHWKKPFLRSVGREIVNKTVKVWNEETKENFIGHVTAYNESTMKHLVMYGDDLDEVWEDLRSQATWEILDDEGAEQFIIQKKKQDSTSEPTSLLHGLGGGMIRGIKNYLFVQTPVKEKMWSKDLIDRCQRNCKVMITPTQHARPPLGPDPSDQEEVEKFQALDESLDGSVWKLTITGNEIEKARGVLQKFAENASRVADSDTKQGDSDANQEAWTEIVIPRLVVDMVRPRLAIVGERFRSVTIEFIPSESKTKQIAKIKLKSSLAQDVESATVYLWSQLIACCKELSMPTMFDGVYKDLGILGGELTSSQFRCLLDATSQNGPVLKNQDAQVDLAAQSRFFASFQNLHKCAVWVQADFDKGRLDSMNRMVNEASLSSPKKVYLGCSPSDVRRYWNLVRTRAIEISRGVKYFYLGADRLYQIVMMKDKQLLPKVYTMTGASVSYDSVTGDHLRIDGESSFAQGHQPSLSPRLQNMSAGERAMLAEEVIRLQIELYRDHFIRKNRNMFGRDWSFTLSKPASGAVSDISSSSARPGKPLSSACLEISDIGAALDASGSIAAHAVNILYRFAHESQDECLKVSREVVLACLFIAQKAQKQTKWRKVESLVEVAYPVIYPGARFDRKKEEVNVLKDKVLNAESQILSSLDYDVFWLGPDWLLAGTKKIGSLGISELSSALDLAYSGPVLATSPKLWLQFGADYVLAACAALMGYDVEILLRTLLLVPMKVYLAAELLVDSVRMGSPTGKKNVDRILCAEKEDLQRKLATLKQEFFKQVEGQSLQLSSLLGSESHQRYTMVAQQSSLKRSITGLSDSVIESAVTPNLSTFVAASSARISIERSGTGLPVMDSGWNVLVEGQWRQVATACMMIKDAVSKVHPSAGSAIRVTVPPSSDQGENHQAKSQAGILRMSTIETTRGWEDTVHSTLLGGSNGPKIGAKGAVAARISKSHLQEAGLRWWIPPAYGASLSCSICDMFLFRKMQADPLDLLGELGGSLGLSSTEFPMLSNIAKQSGTNGLDASAAVSLQRWPSEKIAAAESRGKCGFSPAALQEMQLLTRLHGLIPSPEGHPNFLLPNAIALAAMAENSSNTETEAGAGSNSFSLGIEDDIFSLTRSSEANEHIASKKRKRQEMVSGPHLLFRPVPFSLSRFLDRKKVGDGHRSLGESVLISFFHDLLSAVVHCHSNNILLRTISGEQIVVDGCGVVKLAGLYRSTAVSSNERDFIPTVTSKVDKKKKKKHGKSGKKESKKDSKRDDDDSVKDLYVAPEILLGHSKHTVQSDIWSLGCLFAHLLLGKPLFRAKDRQSLLLSQYKIVGSPSTKSGNFPEGKNYPNYENTDKTYPPSTAKAMNSMLQNNQMPENQAAVDLISQMLQLDPRKRISAATALGHFSMEGYTNLCSTDKFQERFVEEWQDAKKANLQSNGREKSGESRPLKKTKLVPVRLPAAAGEDDELYDLEELISSTPAKKF